MIIAVDFDGTCTTHEYPRIGRDIGAAPVLRRLVAAGHQIMLWTMRSGAELDDAVRWFQTRNIPLYGVNLNPTQQGWTTSPKPYAQLYIDDAALGCPLSAPGRSGERRHVDWEKVAQMLLQGADHSPQESRGSSAGSCAGYQSPDRPQSLLARFMSYISMPS